jgi:hypothetical protein
MFRSKAPVLVGAVIGLLVLSSVALTLSRHTARRTVELDASWPTLYSTVSALKSGSDLAVSGQFTSLVQQTTDPTTGIVYSDFVFKVGTVLADSVGSGAVPGALLTIHQTGGVVGKTTFEVSDDPLFVVGSSAVLFLHEYQTGKFYVVGGPTGRFQLSDTGVATPINAEGIQVKETLSALQASMSNP